MAYFFLKATKLARSLGFLATNTIAQGDTSEVGLTQIIDTGWTIHRAISSTAWPGDATLEIAKVWATSHSWDSERTLEGLAVAGIDEMLYSASESRWRKQRLATNADRSFQGSIVLGMGFTMSPEEAQALIEQNPRNKDVLFPYLGGEDLNQSPTQAAPRWVINFFDWPEDRARGYPECFSIVEEKVRTERQERKANGEFKKRRPLPQRYWIYADKRPKLYRDDRAAGESPGHIESRQGRAARVRARRAGVIRSDRCVRIRRRFHFGVLTSGFHYRWAVRYASSLGTETRYTPSDVFETFPQPPYRNGVASAGGELDAHRSRLMQDRNLGLTSIYNLVHDPNIQSDEGIRRLRDLHVALDIAVRDAYGWGELELAHGFHEVRGQGVRFTFSPEASNRVLELLLELNRERYQAEVSSGLHKRTQTKARARPPVLAGQPSLLGDK